MCLEELLACRTLLWSRGVKVADTHHQTTLEARLLQDALLAMIAL